MIELQQKLTSLSQQERIDILLEEYRALYGLVTFRMTAMDRRLPIAGGLLAALIGSMSALSGETRLWLLLTLPLGLTWLVITTLNHAKSKEDHLRRIDEIERQVNAIAGEELLVFQSRHPKKTPHGTLDRTARGTGFAVMTASLSMLAVCLLVFNGLSVDTIELKVGYVFYVLASVYIIITHGIAFLQYRYKKQPADPAPPSLIR